MNKYQEAINILKSGYTGTINQEAIEILQELVELATPKKPDYEADGYSDGHLVYDTWICPCCGKDYEVEYDDYDYCPNCGQKIDWSEE